MKKYFRFFLLILSLILISLGCQNEVTGPSTSTEPVPDTNGPVITFINPSEGGAVSGTIDIAGVAEDSSELQLVEVRIDGGLWVSSSPPVTITGHYWAYNIDTLTELTEGAHTVEARATDTNSNLGATVTLNFTVNHEYPEIQITSPSLGDLLRGTIDITGTSSATGGVTVTSVQVDPDGEGTSYPYLGVVGISSWTYSGFDTATLSDGSYIMKAVAEANNQNSSMVNIGVTIDNTAPTVAITSHADGEAVTGDFTLVGTTGDAVGTDKVEIKIDSQPNELVAGTTSWSYPVSTAADLVIEGPHTITIIATDTAGNFTQETITVYYDTTPPAITIASPAAGSYLKGSGIIISGTATNTASGDTMEIKFNNGSYGAVDSFNGTTGDWSHTFDTGVFSDGQLTVSLKATDVISTAMDIETITYYVDNIAPTGTISSPAGGASVSGQVIITGNASDNLALAAANGVFIEIVDDDNSVLVNESADITSSLSNNQWSYTWDTATPAPGYTGACTITVTLTDKAGNTTQLTRAVVQSNTAPSVTANVLDPEADGGNIVHGLLTVSGTASDTAGTTPGVSKVEIQFDSLGYNEATWYDQTLPYNGTVNWSYTYDSTTLSDGLHNVYVRVTDEDGGSSDMSLSIEVDNTDPAVTIDYPTNANQDANFLYSTVDVSGTASDINLNTVELQVDSQTPVTPTGTTSWTYTWDTMVYPLAKDDTVLTATATDLAGNTGQAAVTVDVRPRITSLSVSSELVGQSITINGYNFDTAAGSVDVVFQPGGVPETVTTQSSDGYQITVTIPSTATSGNVYVTENSLNSNGEQLDVWEWRQESTLGKAFQQALALSGTEVYQAIYDGGGNKDFYFSKNPGTAGEVTQQLDGAATAAGYNPSIAVYDNGANDEVYLAYIDTTNPSLRFTKSSDSGATFSGAVDLVSGTIANTMTSIALYPSSNKVGITYQDDAGNLSYLDSTDWGDSWNAPQTVDSGTDMGKYSSLAFDSTGTPCIAYYDGAGKQAKFAYYTGVFWVTALIESAQFQGEYPSIKIDSTNGIHVSYYDGNAGDLKYAYATAKDSAFTTTAVASAGITGFHTAITLDGSGNPLISCINYNYSTIRYAYYDGSSWNLLSTPASIGTARLAGTSIAIGLDGYIYIGYVDGAYAYQVIYRP